MLMYRNLPGSFIGLKPLRNFIILFPGLKAGAIKSSGHTHPGESIKPAVGHCCLPNQSPTGAGIKLLAPSGAGL